MTSNIHGFKRSTKDWLPLDISSSNELLVNDSTSHQKLDQIITNTANSGGGGGSTDLKARTDINDENTSTFLLTDSLGKLNTKDTLTHSKLDDIILNTNSMDKDGFGQAYLFSNDGINIRADSSCVIQNDPNYRDGWNMVNEVAGTKFNLYFFDGSQQEISLAEMTSIYFKGFINRYQDIQSMPYLQIYTKPTGVGDAGSFYHSRINYEYDDDSIIGIGEECVFYANEEPTFAFSNRTIPLNNKIVVGEALPAEEILFLVCASSSTATQNEMNATINLLGFNDTIIRQNLKLVNQHEVNQITKGFQDIDASENEGLQQVLCYGRDSQGGLDALNTDTNGHLKITIQDVEPDTIFNTSNLVNRGQIQLGGNNLDGQVWYQDDFTDVINLVEQTEISLAISCLGQLAMNYINVEASNDGVVFFTIDQIYNSYYDPNNDLFLYDQKKGYKYLRFQNKTGVDLDVQHTAYNIMN
jgi:hypothetical protein